jgi:transcriptional regulator with PAS, ATPase and Fis domain
LVDDASVTALRRDARQAARLALIEIGSGAEGPPSWSGRLTLVPTAGGPGGSSAVVHRTDEPAERESPSSSVSNEVMAILRTLRGGVIRPTAASRPFQVAGRPLLGPLRVGDGTVLSMRDRAFVLRLLSGPELGVLAAEQAAEPFGAVPTASAGLAAMHRRLRRLAVSELELLLTGETGSGKEVYALAIHRQSGRTGQFVAINCAAIPGELLESELFGYERGAHSTAAQTKHGLIEVAAGGTLFLDEIGDMPALLQAKLLRFLQDRQVRRLGTTERRHIDVRIIAATNRVIATSRSLRAVGDAVAVRPDLLARLGPEAIVLPPLRARVEDIGPLAHVFLRRHGGPGRRFTSEAFLALCLHQWPSNIRELENAIRWAVTLAEGDVIDLDHLPAALRASLHGPRGRGRPGRGPRPQGSELHAVLTRHRGNVSGAARELERCTATVWRWMNHFGMDVASYRAAARDGLK